MTGPVNVQTISTLNVKSGRPGKCEKKFYAKCEKSLISCMTSQMVSLDNLVGIFGFRGVNVPKVKIFGKCHDLERKCKMLIKGWAGGFSWRFRCKKNRGAFGGFYGVKNSKYIGNILMLQRERRYYQGG